ncbi:MULTISPECIES: glycoside hydrolase family 32 protein [unclassified Microbacterium]|uniref:glycoside hydrolase family 32 protein n=1 Tax=unclassified Microbacterium TaxID=2609290 RepID=UPI00365BDA81
MTRPLIHFSSARNWLNDPNGLIFHDGLYHLYFQYNPHGADHGFMSWGHASSTDLVAWQELPIAIRYTAEHEIFSGCAVFDASNTSGLAADGAAPLVAVFTLADRAAGHQSQGIASSADGGLTWSMFPGNPVLDRGSADFRDPKVFRYSGARGEYWVMVAVEAMQRKVVLYRSDDLRRWEFLSEYGPRGTAFGVWECPDLFPLPVDGDPREVRWVLIVSMNPGGLAGGSGTMYVVGSFDGVRFVPDLVIPEVEAGAESSEAELAALDWLDYGRDCYAGVTFAGLPDEDRILMAWMSNWDYAEQMPPFGIEPQRGAMTLGRRLSLVTADGRIRLRQEPIGPALRTIAAVAEAEVRPGAPLTLDAPTPSRIRLRLRLDHGASAELRFGEEVAPAAVLHVHDGELALDRRIGAAGLPDAFGSVERMPVRGGGLDAVLWLDSGSIELFADDGTAVLTDRVAERSSDCVTLHAVGGSVRIDELIVEAGEVDPA